MNRKWNTFLRIVHTGTVNFIRNMSLAIAAMAVMVVTLAIILFSLIANATFANTITQLTNRIDVSVFLKDDVSKTQAQQLVAKLQKLPNTKQVTYLDKNQALQRFIDQQDNNQDLAQTAAEAQNPIPATILIKPRDLNKIQDIKDYLSKPDIAALQSNEPSYSGDRKKAIDNITHATNILRRIGVVAVIVFAVISVLIIFNTIQMAIFNRRDELTIMRLLGASTWYIRGPFVVESIIYGILSAVISIFIINSAFVASASALQASSLGLLDIGYASDYFSAHFLGFLTLQLAIGIIIGAVSSVIATRRYLKFKTSK